MSESEETRARRPLVAYSVGDRIAHIELDRAEKLNALSNDMHEDLEDALKRFDLDDDAWVAIISGRGRAFCSGADVKSRQQRSADELRRQGGTGGPYGRHVWELMLRSVNAKPIITATHGYAIGSGLSLVLSADLAVAASDTRFQVTEAQRGLPTLNFFGAMRLAGAGASAMEACLTGRFFTAEDALRWDLINRIAAPGDQAAEAERLARQVLAIPPLTVRATVRHRRRALRDRIAATRYEADILKLYLTDDYRRSGKAFLDRDSAPDWTAT